MIKYNNNTINDWNFGASNLIKVYRNNAIVFYKVNGESPTPEYKVCFAVVDDITQYTDREFDDVFDNATEKWYKLNNLNQYEEYGVYGSGRTSCDGSTSRLPQGYTEVEYIENTSTAYINTGFKPNQDTRIVAEMQTVTSTNYGRFIGAGGYDKTNAIQFDYETGANGILHVSWGTVAGWTTYSSCVGDYNKHTYDWNKNEFYRDNTLIGSVTYGNFQCTEYLGIFGNIENNGTAGNFLYGRTYSFQMYDNGTLIRDLVPCKRDRDNKYGMYDLVTNTFYLSPNNVDFSGGEPITPTDCVTTYKGKLTIDDGYEYEWNGSSWVNIGEVTGSTATLPDVPFVLNYNAKNYDSTTYSIPQTNGQTKAVNAIQNYGTNTIVDHSSDGYISVTANTRLTISGGTTPMYRTDTETGCTMTIVSKVRTTNNYSILTCRGSAGTNNMNWMWRYPSNGILLHGSSSYDSPRYFTSTTANPIIASVRVTWDGGVKQQINDWTNNGSYSGNFGYGSHEAVNNDGSLFCDYLTNNDEFWQGDFYWIYMSQEVLSDEEIQQVIDYNERGREQSVYPKYYSEKSDPLDDLTFNTLAEAQTYAYNNCVYDGMKATIDGDIYKFDSSDENGWVKILEYYKVEDVTPNAASGWTISGSSTYNPDSSYYDDFDLETTSTNYLYKIAKVTIYGYDHFTYYIRSHHSYSSSYGYVMATNVDEIQTPPASMSYNSSSAITNTYSWNKSPKSAVNLSNYRRVTYNNLDKTVEHTFYVYYYGRKYSSYVGNATILIPKEQTNENWEQVTFSASSNVASIQKNLYIDNNNLTSGGTNCWYNRWVVGLPSGSHSSYTNYSSYDYCPNTTSSTFTSVAGEQRQVNFTYDNTSNKTLSFRLTDGSNVLTASSTVYYLVYRWNSCNSQSNTTIQLSSTCTAYFKTGGRFSLSNSSDRHYIYGYAPPTLGTTYYVDNYQSTFDIVYTKLSEEAVTITYTTYDPNDSETPAFNTDITYPYNGGTTSSTTLTSFDVPYTYPYEVSQTSDKFSAASQTYTANQAARTINFVLYPNNREFATVADMEAYAYAWEGMKVTVGDTKYQYENGEWVEKASKDSDFVIGDFNTFVSSSTEVTEGYYIIYSYNYNSSYANKNYLFSWNSGNTWSGYYTLGNMNHRDADTSVPISSSEIIDDAVWELKDAGNGNFYIRNVATNKYWYYLGTSSSYGVPLTDNANNATPVSIQNWRNCLAFVEKQSGRNHPINKLYSYPYRYGWYGSLATDGNNQYYMRKYVP